MVEERICEWMAMQTSQPESCATVRVTTSRSRWPSEHTSHVAMRRPNAATTEGDSASRAIAEGMKPNLSCVARSAGREASGAVSTV